MFLINSILKFPAGVDVTDEIEFVTNKKGGTAIIHGGFIFVKNTDRKLVSYYRCNKFKKSCKARIVYGATELDGTFKAHLHKQHNHNSYIWKINLNKKNDSKNNNVTLNIYCRFKKYNLNL